MTRGELINQRRKELGIDVKELAQSANISESYLYSIMSDRIKSPAIDVLKCLAKKLDMDLNTLEGDQERIYYDEPEILSRLPKDLQEFVVKEENTPYLIVAKQLAAYDLSKLTETEMKFLVDWLKMAIKEINN